MNDSIFFIALSFRENNVVVLCRSVCTELYCGVVYDSKVGFALLIRQSEFPQALSEVSVVEYDDLSQVAAWLREHDAELQCVVSDCIDHSRRVPFGRSQQPTLSDYPDAVDVMEFLYDL